MGGRIKSEATNEVEQSIEKLESRVSAASQREGVSVCVCGGGGGGGCTVN